MNGTWTAIAISTCVLACSLTCVWIWYMAWKDGWDAGRDYESSRQYWGMLRERREAERRPVTYGGADGRPPWYVTVSETRRSVSVPGMSLMTLTGAAPAPPRRSTDTGELRALTHATDHFVARVEAEGAAWREQAAAR